MKILLVTLLLGTLYADVTADVHPRTPHAWRDTAQVSYGVQVLLAVSLAVLPNHGKDIPSLVHNLDEQFCHLHILISNSYLYEFLSNSESQMSQCLHLNIGPSFLSKQ